MKRIYELYDCSVLQIFIKLSLNSVCILCCVLFVCNSVWSFNKALACNVARCSFGISVYEATSNKTVTVK